MLTTESKFLMKLYSRNHFAYFMIGALGNSKFLHKINKSMIIYFFILGNSTSLGPVLWCPNYEDWVDWITCWVFNLRIFVPHGLNNSQIPPRLQRLIFVRPNISRVIPDIDPIFVFSWTIFVSQRLIFGQMKIVSTNQNGGNNI